MAKAQQKKIGAQRQRPSHRDEQRDEQRKDMRGSELPEAQ